MNPPKQGIIGYTLRDKRTKLLWMRLSELDKEGEPSFGFHTLKPTKAMFYDLSQAVHLAQLKNCLNPKHKVDVVPLLRIGDTIELGKPLQKQT